MADSANSTPTSKNGTPTRRSFVKSAMAAPVALLPATALALASPNSNDKLLLDYMSEYECRFIEDNLTSDELSFNCDRNNEITELMFDIEADTLAGVESKGRWLEIEENFLSPDDYHGSFKMYQSMMADIRRIGGAA